MTFLPIVERELRVASRRRGTHGMRMKITAAATLAAVVSFFIGQITPALSFGFCLFWGLSGMCMIYALAAGRLMTADCLSREKREGTLGLLFLTDLKGYDVVLGKLAATSLDGLYGLLTVFPLLAVPLLVGGMTNGELWRMALTLVNTFLFSLAVGLFVSSVSRDEQKAMGANLGLLLLLCALLPAFAGLLILAGVLPGRLDQELFYCCPVYALWQCADGEYSKWPGQFWGSIATTFALTLLLLLLACRMAPRSWQDKPVSPRALQRERGRHRRWWRTGNMEKASAFRKRLLGLNAYFWLAARSYLKVSYVWTALGVVGIWWAFTTLVIGHFDDAANYTMALLLNGMIKLWMITEAAHQLAADKKLGAFELLLSTPLTVGDIVRGQWQALRWQFLKPLAVGVAAELTLMIFFRSRSDLAQNRWVWLAGILMLSADTVTVGWVAMSESLTAKSHGRATLKTAALILVLPWALFYGALLATGLGMFLFRRQMRGLPWQYILGCWFVAGIFVDLFYGQKARRRLQQNFRQLALEPPAPKRRFAWLRDLRTGTPERKAELRGKYRRAAVVTAGLVAVATVLALYDLHLAHAHFPKPVIVSISQSNTPLRVIAGRKGFVFILPDGALWRWGPPALGEVSLASPPRQVGTNRDWVQVSVRNSHTFGLR
ncbi:MAG TPA: ABC transporter permease subunit, partial [Candidatus Cybelea sp.]|nr:ABC transporter permease subunit [Candidatus Cybelea sp.]